jgi:hypothetical protein
MTVSPLSARIALVAWAFVLLVTLLGRTSFAASVTLDRATAEADAQAAMIDGHYTFCSSPSHPLSRRAVRMCPLASELTGCEGFAKACDDQLGVKPSKPSSWWPTALAQFMSYLALLAVVLAVAAVVVGIIVTVVRLVRAASEDDAAREPNPASVIVQGIEPPLPTALTSDAEALLRTAAEYAARGSLDLSLFTYLAAALRALDDRGAIRIARHRTHGEYVRGCRELGSKPALREMALAVDKVRFGGQGATSDAVDRAASRATAIVRAPSPGPFDGPAARIATLALLVVSLAACGGGGLLPAGGDPAGDDLLLDLLVREGATARHMTGSLSSLPMDGASGPAVIVNTEKTPLDEETEAHLVAWVAEGGILVLAGDPDDWPKDFWAKRAVGTSRDVRVQTLCPPDDDACAPPRLDHARLVAPAAMTWPHDGALAASATLESGELYAAVRPYQKGLVLGLASDDLLTNAGLSIHGNPSSLVALLESLDKTDFLVTRAENGVAPPSNPFAGLVRIGLGLGLVHALMFALLLFLSVGIRHARPLPDAPPPRRAFTEHVIATATLYARTQATGHALHAYAEYADRELRTKAPRGTSPALFLAQRADANPEDTARLYARAMAARAEDPASGEDLLVLRRLSALFSKAMQASR